MGSAAAAPVRVDRPALEVNPSVRSLRALDWLNFFAADVQMAVGPFVATYLASKDWDQRSVGFALSFATLVGVVCQAPSGALVDWTRHKRSVIAVSLAALSAGALIFALRPTFWPVMVAQALHGLVGYALSAAVAAISLGLVGYRHLGARNGRNHRFDSCGNVFAATAMGWLGYAVSGQAIFWFAATLSIPALVALFSIRADEIDHARARGSGEVAVGPAGQPAGLGEQGGRRRRGGFLETPPRLLFAGCIVLFHCSNAAMLPLVGESVAKTGADRQAQALMSACVIITQFVIAALAPLVGRRADAWGRKPLLLIGWVALPLRGLLFMCTRNPFALAAIEVLDGISATVYFVVAVLVIADLTQGTGRFNLAQSAVFAAAGLGATFSNAAAGWAALRFGYNAAFLGLAAVGALATLTVWFVMPETRLRDEVKSRDRGARR